MVGFLARLTQQYPVFPGGLAGDGMAFEAEITEIYESARGGCGSLWQLVLNRTEFSAGDIGVLRAKARSGAEIAIPVLNVEADAAGVVWHFVRKPLAAGTLIQGEVTPRN
ncbi:MAG: hypothetical protein P4L10_10655 [Acidobacteriaceae bacterium]|nr:hypothetical protein [Acidobacteriaceae bacterium]